MKKDKLLIVILVISIALLFYFTLFYKSSTVKDLNGGGKSGKIWYVVEDHLQEEIYRPHKFEDIRYFKLNPDWTYEFGSVSDMSHPITESMYRLDNDSTLAFRSTSDTNTWKDHHIRMLTNDTLYIERFDDGSFSYGLKMVNKDNYSFAQKENPIKIGD